MWRKIFQKDIEQMCKRKFLFFPHSISFSKEKLLLIALISITHISQFKSHISNKNNFTCCSYSLFFVGSAKFLFNLKINTRRASENLEMNIFFCTKNEIRIFSWKINHKKKMFIKDFLSCAVDLLKISFCHSKMM